MPMEDAEIRARRLTNLRLTAPATDPKELVGWFGAMQSQDLGSGKWSFGVRIPAATEADIDGAVARGEILRTWPMRGTIHFIDPADARWLLNLTGVRALRGVQARWDDLGLDEATVVRGAEVLGEALAGGKRLTRSAARDALMSAGIDAAGQRTYHLLWYAAQTGVTCIGPNEGKEATVVLLDEWAGPQRELSRDQALAELARRYFQSHGPTTCKDFAGWTGLTMADARAAVGLAELDNDADLYFVDHPVGEPPAVLLLPGFDEYLLGYKDRSLFLDPQFASKITPGRNGVFAATVVVQGRVAGTWRRRSLRRTVRVEVSMFGSVPTRVTRAIETAAERYGEYLGAIAEVFVGRS